MGRILPAFYQFFDDGGDPLSLGWLRFLESGTNNTDKTTYADENLSIPNANPLQLDAAGRMPNAFGTGKYRVISYVNDPEDEDSPGEQIQVRDPVTAQGTSAGGGQAGFEAWDNTTTYQLNDIVEHSDTLYRSLIVDNINNNPAVETFAWEEIDFLRFWNENVTYTVDDLVYYAGNLYISKLVLNVNFNPESRFDYWRPVATGIAEVEFKTDDYEVLITQKDYLFVLGPSATSDKTFTLPLVTASFNGFQVWGCNASDYDLSITPQGGATIWLEDPVTIQKGAFVVFRYCSTFDKWQVTGSAGSILGAQELGTIANPITSAYIGSILLADDAPINFGDGNDASLYFDSSLVALSVDLATGVDLLINFNSVNHWSFDSTGPILPGGSNPIPNIGSTSLPIGSVYLGDGDHLYLGDTQDLDIRHSGVDSFITNSTGDLYLSTAASGGDIFFVTAFGNVAQFNSAGVANFLGSISCVGVASFLDDVSISADLFLGDNDHIYLGASNDLDIYHDGSAIAYFTSNSTFRFYTGVTPTLAMLISSDQDVNFYNDINLTTGNRLYFDTSTYIYETGNTLNLVGQTAVLIAANSVAMTINQISGSNPGTTTPGAYFRANIGGTNYYFVGYT